MMRKPVIVGNWKMYKTKEEAASFIKELIPHVQQASSRILLAVPFTAIQTAADAASETAIAIGAQNMNDATKGAFTGEIAASMLLDVGAQFVILGHSERRQLFFEDSAFINKKVKRALKEKLQPIVCVGETLQERQEGKTEERLEQQLLKSLKGVKAKDFDTLIVAYEPVWAIGTGESATPAIAEKAHSFCRAKIKEHFGDEAAEKLTLLYGGSVKPENAAALMEEANIDGLLVGGASLSVEAFKNIVNYKTLVG